MHTSTLIYFNQKRFLENPQLDTQLCSRQKRGIELSFLFLAQVEEISVKMFTHVLNFEIWSRSLVNWHFEQCEKWSRKSERDFRDVSTRICITEYFTVVSSYSLLISVRKKFISTSPTLTRCSLYQLRVNNNCKTHKMSLVSCGTGWICAL